MPTYRKLHTKSVESEDINAMPDDFVRLLWVMLPLGLCQEGRGKDSAAWIRSKIFPIREDADLLERIRAGLDWFEDRGMIKRYEVGGRQFFHILSWHKHQGNTSKEAKTIYPPPPVPLQSNSLPMPDQVQTSSSTDAHVDVEVDADADVDAGAPELHTDPPPKPVKPFTAAMRHYEALYGLFECEADLDALLAVEEEVGVDRVNAAISWAHNKSPPIKNMSAICTAARGWTHSTGPPGNNGQDSLDITLQVVRELEEEERAKHATTTS